MAVGLETELQEPLWLTLLLRDQADGLFAEPLADGLGIDVGGEAIFVIARGDLVDDLIVILHAINMDGYSSYAVNTPQGNLVAMRHPLVRGGAPHLGRLLGVADAAGLADDGDLDLPRVGHLVLDALSDLS